MRGCCQQMKRVEDYLELPYHVELVRDEDEEGNAGWVAEVEELPGCMSQGGTAEEAATHVRDAMQDWISVALEDGKDIPLPRGEGYSGRFVVRIPSTLHAELAHAAERENVSLNSFTVGVLASSVGWRRPEKDAV